MSTRRSSISKTRKRQQDVLQKLSKLRTEGGKPSDYYGVARETEENENFPSNSDVSTLEDSGSEQEYSISEIKKQKRVTVKKSDSKRNSSKNQTTGPSQQPRKVDSTLLFAAHKVPTSTVEKQEKSQRSATGSKHLIADDLLKQLDSDEEDKEKPYMEPSNHTEKLLQLANHSSVQLQQSNVLERHEATEKSVLSEIGNEPVEYTGNTDMNEENNNKDSVDSSSQPLLSCSLVDNNHYEFSCLENGDILVFWYDIEEVTNKGCSSLYIFGKTPMKTNSNHSTGIQGDFLANSFQSVCLSIRNVDRVLYFAPKWSDTQQGDPVITESIIAENVLPEVRELLTPTVPRFHAKIVSRSHPFLDDARIPKESSYYLKVKYPYKYAAPRSEVCREGGQTFSRIFGSTTTMSERLLVKKRMRGPGWLRIRNAKVSLTLPSYVPYQLEIDNLDDITFEEPEMAHFAYCRLNLSILSISLVLLWQDDTKTHEIVAISGLYFPTLPFEFFQNSVLPTKIEQSSFTIMRPLRGQNFPIDFGKVIKTDGNIQTVENEKQMLHSFLEILSKMDPDIILGHDLHSYQLNILLHRLADLRISEWSRIGRLKRSNALEKYLYSKGTTNKHEREWKNPAYYVKQLVSGRMIADTLIVSQELLPKEMEYSVSHLAASLGVETALTPLPDSRQTQSYFASATSLKKLVDLNQHHAKVSFLICCKVAGLPLSLKLASISGYIWSKCLQFGRAERVDFLLAHAFKQLSPKTLLPDKLQTKKKFHDGGSDATTSFQENGKTRKKKAKYEGGLVLEPKKGLYDSLILQLDFNSLYPSIIQEYNICFTTTILFQGSTTDNPEEFWEKLVKQRKQVKESIQRTTDASIQQKLNIEQAALKLTANSVYGCLGSETSRFHAQSLAALVTHFGRLTLEKTTKIARNCDFDVVYGDTDSIFLDTGTKELESVLERGRKLKQEVNRQFRTLEIEVEAIYTRMLLLHKKRYAATRLIDPLLRPGETILEIKGVDLVRHDWCPLSREICLTVLDALLDPNSDREKCLHKIISCLKSYSEKIRQGSIPLEKFIITKSLTQDPAEYNDVSNNPQVQVALRLISKGFPIRAGSFIQYVMCKQQTKENALDGRNPESYHPTEVQESSGKLSLDFEWYLRTQILPPVVRLCDPVMDESERDQLSEACGIAALKSVSSKHSDEVMNHIREKIDARIEKSSSLPWHIRCPFCFSDTEFFEETSLEKLKSNKINFWTPKCTHCGKSFSSDTLANNLHLWLRKIEKKYYTSFWSTISYKGQSEETTTETDFLSMNQVHQSLLELLCRMDPRCVQKRLQKAGHSMFSEGMNENYLVEEHDSYFVVLRSLVRDRLSYLGMRKVYLSSYVSLSI
eukprot:jgi/Galph1/1232/GphlegSOOS_G6044.1